MGFWCGDRPYIGKYFIASLISGSLMGCIYSFRTGGFDFYVQYVLINMN